MVDLRGQLQALFGLDEFRFAQQSVIEDVLAHKDVLCVMPTGAGKSLCYQLPAMVQGGLTLVVSPLISLMEDQVQQLRDKSLPAVFLNSSLSVSIQRQVLRELEEGFEGLLYVAPERFFAPSFSSLIKRLQPRLFAIDEAHCISQWGHDFRPEYARLAEVRDMLGQPPTIALTATATQDVREEIIRQLGLRDPSLVVTGFDRPTLRYECRRVPRVADRDQELLRVLSEEASSSIVYCSTRKAVDEVTALLSGQLRDRPIFAYHAGMDPAARTNNYERFMETPRGIAVATNAFGMGINKPDIRLVVHYNIPGTLEAYYQEAGRAGRDGDPARCVILFNYQDRYTQEFFIERLGDSEGGADPHIIEQRQEHARHKLELMIRYAQSHRCRRQMILDYFDDPTQVSDCDCDVCNAHEHRTSAAASHEVSNELVILVRQLLSGVARCNGKFGVGVVADVLAGGNDSRLEKWNLNQLSVFGLLRAYPSKRIVAMLHRLLETGLVRQRDPEGLRFRPLIELTPTGVSVMKGTQLPPAILSDLTPHHRPASGRPARDPAQEPEEMTDPDTLQRFERLRAARQSIARERQLPAYCICHDRTLKLIAQQAPRDASALERIKGMGPMKVRMYGEALLEAI